MPELFNYVSFHFELLSLLPWSVHVYFNNLWRFCRRNNEANWMYETIVTIQSDFLCKSIDNGFWWINRNEVVFFPYNFHPIIMCSNRSINTVHIESFNRISTVNDIIETISTLKTAHPHKRACCDRHWQFQYS